MHSPSESISSYIRAKDQNRPYWMRRAFTRDATLKMNVKTGAISFPPFSIGIDSITEALVRRFAQSYENVLTFCIGGPPKDDAGSFSCPWMVGMSERETGAVRVGCGRYDWQFQADEPFLARELTITIEFMQILPPTTLEAVMDWLSALPYPWCPGRTAAKDAPGLDALAVILDYIMKNPA